MKPVDHYQHQRFHAENITDLQFGVRESTPLGQWGKV
jgi:hypothetical protein